MIQKEPDFIRPNLYHGSLGDNIKVHFAGSDYQQDCTNSLFLAGVKYRLFTVYPVIVGKKPGDDFFDSSGVCARQQKIFRHVILDSGLFTLMFGSGKHEKQTRSSLTEWQDKTFEFVRQNSLDCTVVEIDCQKVLGVEDAWFFRKRMREMLPNRAINVFHYEDGKSGLDALIEFSDYLAISVPEIRIIKPKTFREDVYRLASYIKNKKPEIDIHLLGCTDKQILRQNRFCTTSDSSSWTGVYRFATIQGKSIYSAKESVLRDIRAEYMQFLGEEKWKSLTPKMQRKNVWELFSAKTHKAIYERYAGNQD